MVRVSCVRKFVDASEVGQFWDFATEQDARRVLGDYFVGNHCQIERRRQMEKTMTVADGYNGSTVELDTTVLEELPHSVKLAVAGKPWLIRWVYRSEYEAAKAQ